MTKPNRWIMKASALLLSYFFVPSQGVWGQSPVTPAKTPELYFYTRPSKQLFSLGESVGITLQLYSRLEQPLLVSRLQGDEFVSFKVVGPDGKEVPWQGGSRSVIKAYSSSDFTVLGQYEQVSANRTISLKDGKGFAFDKPGQYTLTVEFSMDRPETVAPFAGQTKPPMGSFQSEKLAFCIEACINEPLQISRNAPQPSLNTVRLFYTYITRYHQLGIPDGRLKKAIRPLISKRLSQELDYLQSCDDDYYRRSRAIPHTEAEKPSTPWLEAGLFTGPNDAATPRSFRILGSRAIGSDRVDVELNFTTKQTYSPDLHMPPSYDHFEGVVTAILENNRWFIDDYIAMYENDELQRLSVGYSECKAGRWMAEVY